MRSHALLPLLLGACAAPDTSALFTELDLSLPEDTIGVHDALIDLVDGAEDSARIALPGLVDVAVAESLIAAHDRGVLTEVVVDIDRETDPGVAALQQAGVPLQLASGALTYFDFGTNDDVGWTSDQIAMSHAFAVIDRTRVLLADGAGDDLPGRRVLFTGRSEDLGDDLTAEHVQLFGGTDATATTAFDAPAKSIADARWMYPTTGPDLFQLWLSPQERTVKRMIDAVYRARGPIRLMADDVADEGMARALQRKAEDGFDVEVIVGGGFGQANPGLSDALLRQAPDVPVLQAALPGRLPTILFVDLVSEGSTLPLTPTVMVQTFPMVSASRLYAGTEVITDQLTDGALYVLESNRSPTPRQLELVALYGDARLSAEALR